MTSRLIVLHTQEPRVVTTMSDGVTICITIRFKEKRNPLPGTCYRLLHMYIPTSLLFSGHFIPTSVLLGSPNQKMMSRPVKPWDFCVET